MWRKTGLKEGAALAVVLVIVVGLPLAIKAYDQHRLQAITAGRPVFTLYGIASMGRWTSEPMVGWSYFWRKPKPAHIRVRVGQTFVLRVTAIDVHHSFGIPQLQFGPYEIEPGRFREFVLKIDEPGLYTFMCYTVCGAHHTTMMGTIEVVP